MGQPTIYSIGTAIPPHRISQKAHYSILDSANGMNREEKLILRKIYNGSGIEYRHSVLEEFSQDDAETNTVFHPSGNYENASVSTRMTIYERHAAQLSHQATQACFNQLPGFDKASVTHVLTFSCTGMYAPGIDIQIVESMGLNKNVERTCINFMGCYAAINTLKLAYHIARSQPEAVILILGVELCSLHYQKSNSPNQVVANALFGDGSAAAIISAKYIPSLSAVPLALNTFYSEFEQSAAADMVWRIGNAGFDLLLTPEVPGVVKANIAALMQKLFERAGITHSEIDFYAIHPGGMKILEACEQALGLTKEMNATSYEVLRDYGNMSSVTVLFVLQKHMERITTTDSPKKIMACAFGPGITMESMVLQTVPNA